MAQVTSTPPGPKLEDFIEAYEATQARAGQADLAEFLPDRDHPLYEPVLRELVRVDLEYGWQRGRPRPLEEYQTRFPELFRQPDSLEAIAFEEYRLRRQAGEQPAPADYQQRFGVPTAGWPGPAGEGSPAGPEPGGPAAGPANGPPPGAAEDRQEPAVGLPAGVPAAGAPEPGHLEVTLEDAAVAGLVQAALAYREFRQRDAAADGADLEAWLASFPGKSDHAQFFRDMHRSDPGTADRFAQAVTSLPAPGTRFLDFQLIAELGRGAFGTVYLAQQGDLANRYVALKVGTDLLGEPQKLAQLQHTHIVPIYSVHRADPFQAVCMPYFGSTTLADVLKEVRARVTLPDSGKELVSTVVRRRHPPGSTVYAASLPTATNGPAAAGPEAAAGPGSPAAGRTVLERLSYVEAVLWLAVRLADGLAHAHERGILHRDLKPANILLTDDGQPMLLDFNLSEDTKLRASVSAALVGGTLPYMAPEHLEAFAGGPGRVDARSDLFALGVILFELLTGRQPFKVPSGSLPEVLAHLGQDRQRPPPRLRRWNPAVSPAVEAIVRRCLEPEPGRRYQAARELREDLERQLQHRPLCYAREPSLKERVGKWLRRHPRLTSSAGVAALAGTLLLLLGALLAVRGERLARLEAAESLRRFRREAQAVQFVFLNHRSSDQAKLDEGVARCRRLLEHYRVLDDPAWTRLAPVRALPAEDQRRLAEDAGELLLLWARITLHQVVGAAEQAGRDTAVHTALRLNRLAETCFAGAGVPHAVWRQRAELLKRLGQGDEAQRLLARAGAAPARTARDLGLLAGDLAFQGRFREAVPLLQQATRDDPRNFWVWFDLGLCHEYLAEDAAAAACYGTCLALWPDFAPLYVKRGLAYLRQHDYAQACADFDRAIRAQPEQVETYLHRGLARLGLNRPAEALADLTHALDRGAPYTRIYFMRARVREQMGDLAGARRDREEGLRRRPSDEQSWVARGVARLADDAGAALADFDAALALNPRSLAALQNKAHVLAERLGRTEEALAVLDRLLALYPDFVPARGGRGVLLARLGRRAEAHQDAEACLARDAKPATRYQLAGLYALTSTRQADDRREALQHLAAALRQGYGLDQLDRDRDLDPLRGDPAFQRLVDSARPFPTP
jgi:serine/threonine protein kinase/Tfp pilus assembly protein PilF